MLIFCRHGDVNPSPSKRNGLTSIFGPLMTGVGFQLSMTIIREGPRPDFVIRTLNIERINKIPPETSWTMHQIDYVHVKIMWTRLDTQLFSAQRPVMRKVFTCHCVIMQYDFILIQTGDVQLKYIHFVNLYNSSLLWDCLWTSLITGIPIDDMSPQCTHLDSFSTIGIN